MARSFSKGADLQSRQVHSASDAEASLMKPTPRLTFKHCKENSNTSSERKDPMNKETLRQKRASHFEQERPSTPWFEHHRHTDSPSTTSNSTAFEQQGLKIYHHQLLLKLAKVGHTCRLESPTGGEVQLFPQLLPVHHRKIKSPHTKKAFLPE